MRRGGRGDRRRRPRFFRAYLRVADQDWRRADQDWRRAGGALSRDEALRVAEGGHRGGEGTCARGVTVCEEGPGGRRVSCGEAPAQGGDRSKDSASLTSRLACVVRRGGLVPERVGVEGARGEGRGGEGRGGEGRGGEGRGGEGRGGEGRGGGACTSPPSAEDGTGLQCRGPNVSTDAVARQAPVRRRRAPLEIREWRPGQAAAVGVGAEAARRLTCGLGGGREVGGARLGGARRRGGREARGAGGEGGEGSRGDTPCPS